VADMKEPHDGPEGETLLSPKKVKPPVNMSRHDVSKHDCCFHLLTIIMPLYYGRYLHMSIIVSATPLKCLITSRKSALLTKKNERDLLRYNDLLNNRW
jgi:hypothetical protein